VNKLAALCLLLTCTLIAEAKPFIGSRQIPDTFWGTTNHHHHYDWNVGAMKDLGLTCSRVDFVHNALEPAEGVYCFGDANHWIIMSTERGLKEKFDLLAVVSTYGTYDRIEKNPAAFEKFAFEIASKYRGKIRYWEASNEPDMPVIGKQYVIMLKAFYKGIKKADPNNQVVLAGMAGDEAANFELVYKLGGKNYFDIVNSHSYTRPNSPEEGEYIQKIKNLYRVMKKYGDDKPCWVTEVGWNGIEGSMLDYVKAKSENHRVYSCSEEDEARYLARVYMFSASMPWIERVYFFHLAVDPPYSNLRLDSADEYINLYQYYGNGQIAPKTGYYSLKTVIAMLKGATFVEQLDLGQRLWGLTFTSTRNNEGIIALWSLDEQVTLPIQDVAMIKSITSMVGTPILIDKNLKISGRPIYIATDIKNLEALKKQILSARPQGTQAFSLSLGLDTQTSTAVEPVLSLSITNNSPTAQDVPLIKIDLQSPWQLKNLFKRDAAPLSGNETRTYRLPVTGSSARQGGIIDLDVKAWLAGVRPIVSTSNHVRYAVVLPSPEHAEPISLGLTPDQRDIVDWKGANDCSAAWFCTFDRDNLYFHADVRDDVHVQPCTTDPNAINIWRADSIQVALDLEADAKPCSNVSQYDGVNDVEFGLALGLGKSGPVCYIWTNPNGPTGLVPLKDIKITRDEQTKTTHYQAAIPWSTFGFKTDPAGKWMGLNIVINDSDVEGRERKGWLQWTPGISPTKDPSHFNKILFSLRQ